MITNIEILHWICVCTHALRKELMLTLPLFDYILCTLYLSCMQIPYLIHAAIASLSNTLHNSVILPQRSRILPYHILQPHKRATGDGYSSSPCHLSLIANRHSHSDGTAPPRRCRSPSQHSFHRESVFQQTNHYVTVITGCSVVSFTNSGEVPTRPSGIFSGSML